MNSTYIAAVIANLHALEIPKGSITCAAKVLSQAIHEDRLIHFFGVEPLTAGLSAEIFFRGGMLANIDPIFDPAFSLEHGAYRSALCRSLKNLIPNILSYYRHLAAGDPMVAMQLHAGPMQ